MIEKIKNFYRRRRDWVWLGIAIVVIIVATNGSPALYQKATSNMFLAMTKA